MTSPLTGADGNVEFLIHAVTGADRVAAPPDLDEVVAAAVAAHGSA